MAKWLVSMISLLIIVLLYISLSTSKIIIDSEVFGQLPSNLCHTPIDE
jgi:hypothetical protein